jgi:hypothetical protein
VLPPWLAEMNLGVYYAGEDVQSDTIHHLARTRGGDGANRRDPAVPDADVAQSRTVLVDDGSVPEDAIECLVQDLPMPWPCLPAWPRLRNRLG